MYGNNRSALVSRFLDFWLLGGLSIFTLLGMTIFQKYFPAVKINSNSVLYSLVLLKIIFEVPHVLSSYQIAYARGKQFIKKNWVTTLLLPLILAFIFFVIFVKSVFLGLSPESFFVALASGIFFLFGWHRSMQTFGCMLIYSKYDNYLISDFQKKYIKFFLIVMWIFGYLNLNYNAPSFVFYDIKIPRTDVAQNILFVADFGMFLAWLGFAYIIVYKNLKNHKKLPSINFMISPLALFIWWSAFLLNWNFYYFLLPTFHALQHLSFVYGSNFQRPFTSSYSVLSKFSRPLHFCRLVISAAFIYLVSDLLIATFNIPKSISILLGVFIILISLHHYFLDRIIWKSSDNLVKATILN